MLKLVVRSGPQAGMQFPADRPVIRIGRGSGSDIILQDPQASRQHAEIRQQGDQLFIRDLGSSNGTFVNGERITGPRPVQPGDRIQIGDTILSSETVSVGATPVADDWESDLWEDSTEARSATGRPAWLVWALVGLVVILLAAVAVVAVLTLGGGAEETPTPLVVATETSIPTQPAVAAPTDTPEPSPEVPPTDTPLVDVDVPTMEPTVDIQETVLAATPPVDITSPAEFTPPADFTPPVDLTPPGDLPTLPEDLEQLPALVQEYLGDIPPEELPQAIAGYIQSAGPEQVEEMIGALFPGVSREQLPAVVAASFPGLTEPEVEGLLMMIFPGENVEVPEFGGPIGGKIALGIYDRNRNAYDLYLADTAFEQPRLLAENATDPGFSPDGQFIVYHSSAPDKGGLRIMRADGSGDRQLTSIASDRTPRISPDNTRVLFSNIDNNSLVVINLDGSGRRDIGQGKYPDWSPDGNQIVYQGCVGGGNCGLIVANADGSNPRQITTHANDTMPRWRYGNIAFMSDRDGNLEIYVINPDGTWLRRITLNEATDIMAVWDPGGVRLAFRSDRNGKRAVYTTSGIGGGDFLHFGAEFGADWMLAGMDWGE